MPSTDDDAACEGGAASGSPHVLSYDEALDLAGVGPFTTRMTLLCGLGNAADAVELLAVSLVLPAVGPDGRGALRLSLAQMAALSSALFWGALLGTVAWGVASDALGRRTALTAAMAVAGGFGLLSAAATSFAGLVLCRMLAGVGVGGSVPVVFAYLAELLPAAVRGRYMCVLAAHWMVGSVATALLGWALVPYAPVAGWRVFLAVAALPSLLCAALTWRWAPESPRFLLQQRRPAEAMAVLRGIAARNGRAVHTIPEHATLASQRAAAAEHAPHSGARAAVAEATRQAAVALRAALTPPMRVRSARSGDCLSVELLLTPHCALPNRRRRCGCASCGSASASGGTARCFGSRNTSKSATPPPKPTPTHTCRRWRRQHPARGRCRLMRAPSRTSWRLRLRTCRATRRRL